ncbi:MAG: hypothetical protein BRC58_01115 [Cyanobacteria bacterium QS_8_64_29]|nr:MAG: hypothetical protein BRC58_01115 [Cyanobacteria bacterium QS_8_64_29]
MFAQPEFLAFSSHGHLYLKPIGHYRFAADLAAAPLSGSEVPEAAKHFPVVFAREGESLLPRAIFSVRAGENAFVAADGTWQAPYVPTYVRCYPFVLSPTRSGDRFAIAIDRTAPQLQAADRAHPDSDPLFDASGNPAPALERVKALLIQFQRDCHQTERLLSPLAQRQVLVARQFQLKLGEETASTLGGFRTLDPQQLGAVDDATLAEWVRNGTTGIAFAHLHSLSNMRGLAERQKAQLAAEAR